MNVRITNDAIITNGDEITIFYSSSRDPTVYNQSGNKIIIFHTYIHDLVPTHHEWYSNITIDVIEHDNQIELYNKHDEDVKIICIITSTLKYIQIADNLISQGIFGRVPVKSPTLYFGNYIFLGRNIIKLVIQENPTRQHFRGDTAILTLNKDVYVMDNQHDVFLQHQTINDYILTTIGDVLEFDLLKSKGNIILKGRIYNLLIERTMFGRVMNDGYDFILAHK